MTSRSLFVSTAVTNDVYSGFPLHLEVKYKSTAIGVSENESKISYSQDQRQSMQLNLLQIKKNPSHVFPSCII